MNGLLPPYPLIRDGLLEGRVIPFLGSGASLTQRVPKDAPWREPPDVVWKESKAVYLPRAAELASYLAQRTQFPTNESQDLAKVAQYYNVVGGRSLLRAELHGIFDWNYPVTSLHRHLADLPAPLLIVTTNYDDLIERAFRDKGRPYDLVVHTTEPDAGDRLLWWPHGETSPHEVVPNKCLIKLEKITVIYKMHGTVVPREPKRDQYVITEDDYIDFLARMTKNKAIPSIFAEPFQTRPFLFLGYSLSDWNLRVVLNRIEKDLRHPKSIKSWAIQYDPSLLEQRFWQERGVEVYRMTIEDFVQNL